MVHNYVSGKEEVVFGAKLVDTDACDPRTGETSKFFILEIFAFLK